MTGCAHQTPLSDPQTAAAEKNVDAAGASALSLKSDAFPSDGAMPAWCGCKGRDMSPALSWSGAPKQAGSLALTVEDPDAPGGTFTHWILFDIPPRQTSLPADLPVTPMLAGGMKQGVNDFRKIGYGGPCPPSGTHHYIFKLYALDAMLNLNPGIGKAEFVRALNGHVLGRGQLMGTMSVS